MKPPPYLPHFQEKSVGRVGVPIVPLSATTFLDKTHRCSGIYNCTQTSIYIAREETHSVPTRSSHILLVACRLLPPWELGPSMGYGKIMNSGRAGEIPGGGMYICIYIYVYIYMYIYIYRYCVFPGNRVADRGEIGTPTLPTDFPGKCGR